MNTIYTDFFKAFDKVYHSLLLSKLHATGFVDGVVAVFLEAELSLLKWTSLIGLIGLQTFQECRVIADFFCLCWLILGSVDCSYLLELFIKSYKIKKSSFQEKRSNTNFLGNYLVAVLKIKK